MAETIEAQTQLAKITSMKAPIRADFPVAVAAENVNGGEAVVDDKGGANAGVVTPAVTNTESGTPPPAATPPPATNTPTDDIDEVKLKAYFEKQGINFDGIDKLKEKLAQPAPQQELTDEQKKQAEQNKEKRLVDEHLSRNGNVEQYSLFKNIIVADKKELGLQREVEDLISLGFEKEKAIQYANERYFQFTEEEIEAIDDPTLKAEAIKQREAGIKKLERKGAYIQNTAKSYLDTLAKDLQERDAEKLKMEQHTAKVADAVTKFLRKEPLAIGQVDGQDIAPIDFEYSDTALTSAKEILSDAAKFEQNLFTKDGDVNIDFILPHLVRSFSISDAVKKSYLTGATREVEKFEAKFGPTIPSLGGNGKNTGTPGKIANWGKPQYVQRQAK